MKKLERIFKVVLSYLNAGLDYIVVQLKLLVNDIKTNGFQFKKEDNNYNWRLIIALSIVILFLVNAVSSYNYNRNWNADDPSKVSYSQKKSDEVYNRVKDKYDNINEANTESMAKANAEADEQKKKNGGQTDDQLIDNTHRLLVTISSKYMVDGVHGSMPKDLDRQENESLPDYYNRLKDYQANGDHEGWIETYRALRKEHPPHLLKEGEADPLKEITMDVNSVNLEP